MRYSDKYDDSIRGICSLVFGRADEEYEKLFIVIKVLIEEVIRKERGLPLSDEPEE